MKSPELAKVVIPAFNEELRITGVIEAVQLANPFLVDTEQIIVVDNNSTDRTVEIVRDMGAVILSCERQGKGWSMQAGAERAKQLGASVITFLDADLIGLKGEHVDQLTEPVLRGDTVMNIGILGGRNWMSELNSRVFKLSGQRSVDMAVWDNLRDFDFKGWRTEWALNKVCKNIGMKKSVDLTKLADLRHVGTYDKEDNDIVGFIKYLYKYGSAAVGSLTQSGKDSN